MFGLQADGDVLPAGARSGFLRSGGPDLAAGRSLRAAGGENRPRPFNYLLRLPVGNAAPVAPPAAAPIAAPLPPPIKAPTPAPPAAPNAPRLSRVFLLLLRLRRVEVRRVEVLLVV